jgi:hypothetical protein
MSKYTTWYQQLVNSRKFRERIIDTYYERHHIMPKSLGGANCSENLVYLLPREHFIAHLLLAKIYDGHEKYGAKMAHAVNLMLRGHKNKRYTPNSRMYQIVRTLMMTNSRGPGNHMYGKTGINSPNFGKHPSAETRKKIGLASKNRIPWNKGKTGAQSMSVEVKIKMSASHKGKSKSVEHKQKIGDAQRGKAKSKEQISKQSGDNHYSRVPGFVSKKKGMPDIKVICPHCNKEGGRSLMTRYHFDNCKFKA